MNSLWFTDGLQKHLGKYDWKGTGAGWGFTGTFCLGKMNLGHNQGLGVWYYDGVSGRIKQHGNKGTFADNSARILSLVYNGEDGSSTIWADGVQTSINTGVYRFLPSTSIRM